MRVTWSTPWYGCFYDTSETASMDCGRLKPDGTEGGEEKRGVNQRRQGQCHCVFIEHLLKDFTPLSFCPSQFNSAPPYTLSHKLYISYPSTRSSIWILTDRWMDRFEIIPTTIESTHSLQPTNRADVDKQANPILMMSGCYGNQSDADKNGGKRRETVPQSSTM